MAYTSLYRNFRPIRFSDMVGQDHITRTIRNQIMSDRVGHAYLFTGGRGTGKTTSAKILARVVNSVPPPVNRFSKKSQNTIIFPLKKCVVNLASVISKLLAKSPCLFLAKSSL